MNFERKDLFATPVWTFNFKNENSELVEMLKYDVNPFIDKNAPIDYKLNFLDYPTYGIKLLRDYIFIAIYEVMKEMRWVEIYGERFGKMTPKIIKSRSNVINPNQSDTAHSHYSSHLTGIYYVSVPENSGDLLLYETRGSIHPIWKDKHVEHIDKYGRTGRVIYKMKPEEGTLVLFPSYLIHGVDTNCSNYDRISVPFDVHINVENDGLCENSYGII